MYGVRDGLERGNDVIPLDEAVEGVRVCDAIVRSATQGSRIRLDPAPVPASRP